MEVHPSGEGPLLNPFSFNWNTNTERTSVRICASHVHSHRFRVNIRPDATRLLTFDLFYFLFKLNQKKQNKSETAQGSGCRSEVTFVTRRTHLWVYYGQMFVCHSVASGEPQEVMSSKISHTFEQTAVRDWDISVLSVHLNNVELMDAARFLISH